MDNKISAIILTYNEEENIRRCLESLTWVDELIVIDGYSEDRTVEIASEYTDKVYKERTESSFDHLRQLGVEESSNEWILTIDADEIISEKLRSKIISLNLDEEEVVKAPRLNYIFGEEMKRCGWWPDYQLLMFRKDRVQFTEKLHDFVNIESGASVRKLEKEESNAIVHFSLKGVSDFISSTNRYTDIDLEDYKHGNYAKKAYIPFKIFLIPLRTFLVTYLLKKGYRAGVRGFMLSILEAYTDHIRYLKRIQFQLIGSENDIEESYETEADKYFN